MNIPAYCSIRTVAEQLDCSETTVRDYVKHGKLPQPTRRCGLIRWKWDEVANWMDGAKDGAEQVDPIMKAITGP